MEKIQFAIPLPGVTQKNLGLWLKSLHLGQVLQARVIDRSLSGNLILRVAGHQITATADIPVHKGTLLNLEVSGLYPAVSMKIINLLLPGMSLSNPLESQYQLLLPRQGSVLAPLLTLLEPAQRVNLLSLLGVKNGLLDSLHNSLSHFELLTDPKTLQKAILLSGFFLESELLRLVDAGGFLSRADLKGMLFRLLHRINQALSRLRTGIGSDTAPEILSSLQVELEGAIATITLNQLSACQVNERDGCIWLFDMPFRIRDSLHSLSVTIEREGTASQDQPESQEWIVLLSVSLPRLGTIEAELFLRESKVSAVFYLERERTFRLLDERLYQLRAGLESRGFKVSVLRCHQGKRLADGPNARWRQCVDEKI